jgi:Transmembrane domain of unknown function (DUF3566)
VSRGNAEEPPVQTQARQALQENPERPAPQDPPMGNGSQSQRPEDQRPQEQNPQGPSAAEEPKSPNGQKKDDSEEQLASAPQGTQPGAADRGNTAGQPSPWTAAHVQRTAGRNPAGLASTPPVQPRAGQGQPGQAQPGQAQPGQAHPGQAHPGQAHPGQAHPGGQVISAAPPQSQASTPVASTQRPTERAVPVWDPPPLPQPKQSLLSRLGIAKKGALPEGESPASSAAQTAAATPTQQETAAQPPPPAGAVPGAAGLTGAAAAQSDPQAPPRQPSTQAPGRPEETTGRTPRVVGGAGPVPVAPTTGPQARMPTAPVDPATRMPPAPTHPGAPGPFPVPAPVQALKDAATGTGPAVPQTAAGAAQVPGAPEAHHLAKPKVGVARRTRKARLRLSRLDPWSVMKTSFLFSIAAGIMLVVAVYSIWTVLSTSGLFDSINEIVRSVVSTPGDTTPFRIEEYINTQKVMGVTALIACVDVVIFTALATLGSFLYNLAATMLGGLEITLAED